MADPTGPPCPKCSMAGNPTSITVSDGQRVITYRCPQCQHVWTVTAKDTVDATR